MSGTTEFKNFNKLTALTTVHALQEFESARSSYWGLREVVVKRAFWFLS